MDIFFLIYIVTTPNIFIVSEEVQVAWEKKVIC